MWGPRLEFSTISTIIAGISVEYPLGYSISTTSLSVAMRRFSITHYRPWSELRAIIRTLTLYWEFSVSNLTTNYFIIQSQWFRINEQTTIRTPTVFLVVLQSKIMITHCDTYEKDSWSSGGCYVPKCRTIIFESYRQSITVTDRWSLFLSSKFPP